MNRLGIAGVAAGVVVGVGGTILVQKLAEPKDGRSIATKAQNRVVLVETWNADGEKLGFGTGFLIDEGEVATNWHVVDEAESVTATDIDGVTYEATGLLGADVEADVAVVEFEGFDLGGLKLAADVDAAKPGARVIVVGNPRGHTGTVTEGVVSSVIEKKIGLRTVDELQISAPVSPGSSGSPVIDARSGKVIGIAARVSDSEQVNFAVGIGALHGARERRWPDQLPHWANTAYSELEDDSNLRKILKEHSPQWDRGNFARCLEITSQLVEAYPDNADSLRMHGAVLVKLGRPDVALPFLKKVAEIEPHLGVHWKNLALAHYHADRYTLAAKAGERLIGACPDDYIYRIMAVYFHDRAGDQTAVDAGLEDLRLFGSSGKPVKIEFVRKLLEPEIATP